MICAREGCDNPTEARGPRALYCTRECQQNRASTKAEARPRRVRGTIPKGCDMAEALVGADGGTVTSGPVEPRGEAGDLHQSWDWLLEMHGLDPAHFEIVGETVNARTWDAHYGVDQPSRKFAYYKADFRRRVPLAGLDFNALRASLLARVKPRRWAATGAPVSFVMVLADPQFGKSDGDGTEGTLARVRNGITAAAEKIEEHRRAGYNVEDVLIAYLGDNTEGVAGQYEMQGFSVDLGLTEQIEAATDMAILADAVMLGSAASVLHVAVPGNHGEVRNGSGRAFTKFSDNYDTHAIRQAAKVSRAAGHSDRSRWVFPTGDELSVTLRHRERVHTFLHGHAGRVNAITAHGKIVAWAKSQAFGLRAPGESDVVWSGHYHHASIVEQGRRVFIQAPALDGGSVWFAESAGIETPPGILTALLTGAPGIAGVANAHVIAADPQPPTWMDHAEAA